MATIPDWKQALLLKKQLKKESEKQQKIEELKRLESIPGWKRQILEKRQTDRRTLAEGNTFRVKPNEPVPPSHTTSGEKPSESRNAQTSPDVASTKNFLRRGKQQPEAFSKERGVSEEHCRSVQNNPFLVSDAVKKFKRRSFSPTNVTVVDDTQKEPSNDVDSGDFAGKTEGTNNNSKAKNREVIVIPKDDLENLIIVDAKSEQTKRQPAPKTHPSSHSDAANNKKIGKLLGRFGKPASFEDLRETVIRARENSIEKRPPHNPDDGKASVSPAPISDQIKIAQQPPVILRRARPLSSNTEAKRPASIHSSTPNAGRPSQNRPSSVIVDTTRSVNSQPPSLATSEPPMAPSKVQERQDSSKVVDMTKSVNSQLSSLETGKPSVAPSKAQERQEGPGKGVKKSSERVETQRTSPLEIRASQASSKVVKKSNEQVDSPALVAPPRRKKRGKLPASLLIRLDSDGPIDPSELEQALAKAREEQAKAATNDAEEIPVTSIDEPPPPSPPAASKTEPPPAALPGSKSDTELLSNGLAKPAPGESRSAVSVARERPTPARRVLVQGSAPSPGSREPARTRQETQPKDIEGKGGLTNGSNLQGLSKARQAVARLKQASTTLHFTPDPNKPLPVPVTNIDDVEPPQVNGTASHDEDDNGGSGAARRATGKLKKSGVPVIIGANEPIEKPSMLKKPGSKSKKMSLSFNEKTVTHEYPSETSLLEDEAPSAESGGAPLKTNTPLGDSAKGSLHNYTPNYLQKAVFGRAAQEPPKRTEPPKPEPTPEPQETAAKPLDDSQADYFSSSSTSALLF